MLAKLTCKSGMLTKTEFLVQSSLTIGAASRNDVVLKRNTVSNKHARIFFDGKEKGYFAEDLRSHNGTMLDGIPLTAPRRLGVVHVLTIADKFDFIFQPVMEEPPAVVTVENRQPVVTESSGRALATIIEEIPFEVREDTQPQRFTAPATIMEDIRGSRPVQQEQPEKTSYFLAFDKLARQFELTPGRNVLGRGSTCEIQIGHYSVSRQHALILVQENEITIEDLGSKNHTLVESRQLFDRAAISAGSRVQFGKLEAVVMQRKEKAWSDLQIT